MHALYGLLVAPSPRAEGDVPEFVKQAIWDKQKAVMSFVKTDSPCVVPDQGNFEAVFWFRNRPGGNVASGVQVSHLEMLLIWPDVHVCNVGSANFGGPTDVGPGELWNFRIILSPWMVQKQDVQVRASVDYIAGTNPTTGKDRPASTPFCQELDKTTGQLRWVSCLGKPTPVCSRLIVE